MSETNKNNKPSLNESDLSQVSGGIGFEFLADQAKARAALADQTRVRAALASERILRSALISDPNATDTAAASESDSSL